MLHTDLTGQTMGVNLLLVSNFSAIYSDKT